MLHLYVRTSSTVQEEANGTDAQRAAIEGWLKSNAAGKPFLWWEDSATSGKSMDRKAWNDMLAVVEGGDTIILYDLSRAGRTLKGLITWAEEMLDKGVRVVFVKDSIDISTAMGRFILQIMGAVAELERHRINARCKDGIAAVLASGRKWGAATKIKKGKPGYQQLTDEEWDRARVMLEAGESFTSVAKAAGISRSGLHYRWKKYQQSLAKEAA